MDFSDVLMSLGGEATLRVESSDELRDAVHRRARKMSTKDSAYLYRRWPSAMAPAHCPRTTPAQVLHELGMATTFFSEPAFADIARRWVCLRYCATLVRDPSDYLALSQDAEEVVHHHKAVQSEQLGIGLALVVAKEALRRQYPGWVFSAVDAEVALRAGFVGGLAPVRQTSPSKRRPDYFLVGRKRGGGGGFRVVVLECKGTHSDRSYALTQLATAGVQVQTVEVGGSVPPGLMVASSLSPSGIVSYLLEVKGDDELWSGPDEQFGELLDEHVDELLAAPCEELDLQPSSPALETFHARRAPGALQVFGIPAERRSWFFRVLARTAAANALLFAGDGVHAAEYATARQRLHSRSQADGSLASGPEPVNLVRPIRLADGLVLQGTFDQAPLPDGRVLEVHRGVDQELYQLLEEGRVGPYFRAAGRVRSRWLEARARSRPDGIVSVGHDGTVLSLRIR